ncbi:MAG: NAD(P)H-dependent oxidoreductase [Flavobacteriaceae bacterium]|tara:strand:- start:25821 stop:26456 length:636 start_codon:yes stop_codon:yes gene_type:complete
MKNIIDALEWRYAVKKFNEEALLSEQQLEAVKKAFNLSASSYGLQPYKLVMLQNKTLQERLLPHSYNQKQVVQAAAVLVFCIRKDIDSSYIDGYFGLIASARGQTPESLDGYKNFMKSTLVGKTPAEMSLWATNQVYLNMGTLLTACAAMEIDSCPMEGFSPAGYNEVLELDKMGLEAVLVMPIGIRASDDSVAILKKVRKPLEEAVITIS